MKDNKKIEAYLQYLASQMGILHGILLFDDDKEFAKEKSIENTSKLYEVINPDIAYAYPDMSLLTKALEKMEWPEYIQPVKDKENQND